VGIKNIQDLDIRAFNIGVGENIGNMELYDYDINDGSAHASLYKSVITDLHKGNSVSHIVKIINIDNFLEKANINKVGLMKIDTEGNEYKVLIGAKSSIEAKKIKAIQFEFNEMNIVSKASFKDFWDILYNYKLYRLLPGGELLEIKKYNPLMTEIYGFQNIVAILND
jgi:FkbM family methyltransferase